MESTYGLPHFRFPDRAIVVEELLEHVRGAMRENRQPIVMGYSLGKAQEIIRILTNARINVTAHGAVHSICRIYEELSVSLGNVRRYSREDFHGPKAIDLLERGVLVAPPNNARSGFVTSFDKPLTVVMSGWGLLKNARFRYGVDHVLPLSDHADFDELIETVERVNPKKVYTHHGFAEFAETLKARGWDAELARPDEQMMLFE
jgi:DNA ligase-1